MSTLVFSPFRSFNRDSENIPENRRTPILSGIFGEERVSHAGTYFTWISRNG